MHRFTAITMAMLLAIIAAPALAQEAEIYIPGRSNQEAFPKRQPENYLARCLANPENRFACYQASSATNDGGLESAVQGQLKPATYVTCKAKGGVCLEVATYDPDAPDDLAAPAKQADPQARLPSIDITILFDLDKATIRASERAKLTQLAAALKHRHASAIRFAVIGHTDATGTVRHNCRLSAARARAVAAHLVALGVASDRLKAIGAGEAILRNAANPAAAANRRVGLARLGDGADSRDIIGKLARLCR